MATTLKQIAELANVSLASASRVINDKPGVRPEIRERIRQIILDYGYQPNQIARSLAKARTQKEQE